MSAEHKGKSSKVTSFVTAEDPDDVTHPLACDRCLGTSSLVRVTKEASAKQCQVCKRPCVVFTFKSAADAKPRSTVICQSCATKTKKCQCCLRPNGDAAAAGARRHDREEAGDGYDSAKGNKAAKPAAAAQPQAKPAASKPAEAPKKKSEGFGFDWMSNLS